MNKVITINLNGRAYQLEEQGYAKLQKYLAEAAQHLATDPDKDEIITDLEQAVAEKFDRVLNAGKNVVTEKEIDQAIEEMGKVEGQAEEKKAEPSVEKKPETKVKRLYRLREGAIIGGVCAGLAAYLNIDVTIVRLIFILLTLATGGGMIIVYVVLMIVLPQAETAAETATAFGEPFTAQEFINRAREGFKTFADKNERKKWKHEVKQRLREERWKRRHYYYTNLPAYPYPPFWRLLVVFVSLVWILELFTIIFKGTFFGVSVAPFFPIWLAVLGWIFVYVAIIRPLRWRRRMVAEGFAVGNQVIFYRHCGLICLLGWIAFWVIVAIAIYHYFPGSHQYFQVAGEWGKNFQQSFNTR
ncbi:MAG TPA: PspC domain-containing protein [Candidatus Methylomirabilis sp.]|nr:PspC domain-containing protein [Candidatus Methylomirabilis sp.]